jgi:hypothetical protein
MKKLEEKMNCLEININELKTHNKKEAAVEPFKCDQCPYSCTSSTALKSHRTKKHKSITVVADVVATSLPQLDGHADASDEEQDEIIKCNICHHEASSSSEFDSHISKEHNGIPHTSQWEDNVCHFCDKSFTNTFNFKDHMTSHHSFTLDCDVCYNCDESPIVGRFEVSFDQRVTMLCSSCRAYRDKELYDT